MQRGDGGGSEAVLGGGDEATGGFGTVVGDGVEGVVVGGLDPAEFDSAEAVEPKGGEDNHGGGDEGRDDSLEQQFQQHGVFLRGWGSWRLWRRMGERSREKW